MKYLFLVMILSCSLYTMCMNNDNSSTDTNSNPFDQSIEATCDYITTTPSGNS